MLRLFLILIVSLGSIDLAYAINVPANASLSYSGTSWDCNKGFRQSGNSCIKVVVPRNATLSYSGHSWDCSKGFRQSGNSCVKVGGLKEGYASDGNSFCSYGYVRKGNKCVEVNYPKDY